MKFLFKTFLLLTVALKGMGQNIPPEYKLLVSLQLSADEKFYSANDILIDDVKNYLLVSYDYNPTYLVLYDMKTWNKIKVFKTKGFTYFRNSYFFGSLLYLYKGEGLKTKYVKIDLTTFTETKAPCDDVPRGCEYDKPDYVDPKVELGKDPLFSLVNNGWHIIEAHDSITDIYIKQKH